MCVCTNWKVCATKRGRVRGVAMSEVAVLAPTYEAVCLHKLESLCYEEADGVRGARVYGCMYVYVYTPSSRWC